MSENGGGWPQTPRPPQHSRGFQDPRGPQDPRIPQNAPVPQRPQRSHGLPDGNAWRPDEHLRPLPPEYEPVHHEPRYDDLRPVRPQVQGRPEDSPWRMTQRFSRPEATEWHPGPAAQASYDPGEFRPQDQYGEQARYEETRYQEPGQYPGDGEYEDEDRGRFVPGFGDDDDAVRGRRGRSRRPPARRGGQDSRGRAGGGGAAAVPGAGSAGSRRWPRCWSSSSRWPWAASTSTAST